MTAFLTEQCRAEHVDQEQWIVCIHTTAIAAARRTYDVEGLTGEAVCSRCRAELDQKIVVDEHYRFACGQCVRDRWPLENAS